MSEKQEFSPHHRADVEVAQDGGKVTLKAPAAGVTLTADEALELASRIFEAAALATGGNLEDEDMIRIPVQYIRVAAERIEFEIEGQGTVAPNDDPEMGDAKTAEVHCWVKDQTLRNAMHIAAGWIAEHGWVIGELYEQRPVTRADFEGTENLQYFEQALLEGEVFLYLIEAGDETSQGEETEGTENAS